MNLVNLAIFHHYSVAHVIHVTKQLVFLEFMIWTLFAAINVKLKAWLHPSIVFIAKYHVILLKLVHSVPSLYNSVPGVLHFH